MRRVADYTPSGIARRLGASLLIGMTTASAVAGPTLMHGGAKVDAVYGKDDREGVRWEEYPWIVRLLGPEGRHVCTGFVISDKIVSAGHCSMLNGTWRHDRPRAAEVFTGETFEIVQHSVACEYKGAMEWRRDRGWVYPDYEQISDDIAVLTTRRDISRVTGKAPPVSYSQSAHDESEEVLMVGFHGDRHGLMAQTCEVRWVDSPVLSDRAGTTCDSYGGSSGSPLLLVDKRGDFAVAAIHVASDAHGSFGGYLGAHDSVKRWLSSKLAEVTASSTTPAWPTGQADLDNILSGHPRGPNGMGL